MSSDGQITIVGCGLSGLAAARRLVREGVSIRIHCAGSAVGGRVRTDLWETERGLYRLDRGFQVYLDAYEEASEALDLEALELKPFYPGALVRFRDTFHRVADPFRRPIDAVRAFGSPIATLADKARLALLDQSIRRLSVDQIYARPERRTIDLLTEAGMSDSVVDRFFRPFFGGVFFDRSLETSSRMFEFTYKHFATGRTTLPATGMGTIPAQLADGLLETGRVEILTDSPVARVDPASGELLLASGETEPVDRVLVATDGCAQAMLFGEQPTVPFRETATVYFDADPATLGSLGSEAILVLDGEGTGPVNHLAVPSMACPRYAPSGRALVCANIVDPSHLTRLADDGSLDQAVRSHLTGWLGNGVSGWRTLRTYRIRQALPRFVPGQRCLSPAAATYERGGRVYVTGDHLTHGSIEGAMVAGRMAAESMLNASPETVMPTP
ncbi:MAG: NAD(P)/FAD-dependent oxidoreductase [Planctomycetota bacterium]